MVSIIIPCFNSGKYLSECLESVLSQDYTDFEAIVVNDCSTDNTLEIAYSYAQTDARIKIIDNSGSAGPGASAARNKGFKTSKGEYVVFLDSDDIWLPTALRRLVNLIEKHNEAGWVIGNCIYFNNYRYNLVSYERSLYDFNEGIYDKFNLITKFIKNFSQTPVPGATILKRDIVERIGGWENKFRKNYTDQAFFIKILCDAKTFVSHDVFLLYRCHSESSSMISVQSGQFKKNEIFFFEWLLLYLRSYEFRGKEEVLQYSAEMIKNNEDIGSQSKINNQPLRILLQKAKKIPRKARTLSRIIFRIIFRLIPKNIYRHFLHQGVRPHSEQYGADRGTEIARYYTECFLEKNKAHFQGNCLEFQEPTYLLKYADRLNCKFDIIHLDDSNFLASIVADLTKPNRIPSDYFDCIICTHVLHIIFEMPDFLAGIKRILKPGGYLFLTVPGISMCDYSWHELWRFTEEGIQLLLEQHFEKDSVQVEGFGNSLVAAGQIRGLSKEEFSIKELSSYDGRFAVEICARAQKTL